VYNRKKNGNGRNETGKRTSCYATQLKLADTNASIQHACFGINFKKNVVDAITWKSVGISRQEVIRILTSISNISMKGADIRKETKFRLSTSFSNSSISFKYLS
jgi:hypothetical protein